MSPTELLEEQLSDKALSRTRNAVRDARVLDAALIALRAVRTAAAAGNVTCIFALKEIALCLPSK
jgi:hypothetical protein